MSPKPYCPSNGSEGMDFMARFCAACACEPENIMDGDYDGCPIIALTMIHKSGASVQFDAAEWADFMLAGRLSLSPEGGDQGDMEAQSQPGSDDGAPTPRSLQGPGSGGGEG